MHTYLRSTGRDVPGASASWRIGLALAAATLLCGVLWGARVLVTKEFHFVYLVWNLFLAWLPLVFAIVTRQSYEYHGWCPRTLLAGIAWLLFLPNASYIVTDLIHLRHHTPVPTWFDPALFAAFAFTGVALGFVSLRLLHDVVAERRGWVQGWLFVLGILVLCGIGIYLGRVERWNSWSVLTEPHILLADIQEICASARDARELCRFTGVFFVFLTLCYVLFFGLAHWPAPAMSRNEPWPDDPRLNPRRAL